MSWNTLPNHEREQLTARLSPKQHDVYILWLAGCGYNRIAAMLNISRSTVITHNKRAKQIHQDIATEVTE